MRKLLVGWRQKTTYAVSLTACVAIVCFLCVASDPAWPMAILSASFCILMILSMTDPTPRTGDRAPIVNLVIVLLMSPVGIDQAIFLWGQRDRINAVSMGAISVVSIPFCIKMLIEYFRHQKP